VGKASLYWAENGKDRALVIEGKSDGLVRMSENLTDQQVAERIYNCLDTVFDNSLRVSTSGATIIPTLYRLIGRHERGEAIQPYQVEQVLEGLRVHIGLKEGVNLIADKINLQCEGVSSSIWAWFYTWEHEYVSPGSMFAASDGVFGPTLDNPGADVVVTEGALMKAWQTPRIVINLESAEVYLADEDDQKELLSPNTKDEDVAAKILSMSFQKESLARGRVIERWQDTLRQEVSESTLEEGWEQPFRDSLGEADLTWDPRDHPRDPNSGEFIDMSKATHSHKRAATRAFQKRQKEADKPTQEIPTKREPVKPSRSKYDPQEPKAEMPPEAQPPTATSEPKQEEPPAPQIEEPKKAAQEPTKEPASPQEPPKEPEAQLPAPEQPQAAQQQPSPETPPAGGFTPMPGAPQPVPVLDPMTGQPMVDPMTGQPVMQFVNPIVPGAPEPRLPTPPKKGKQLPQDQPYKPKEGEAPKLPVPPTSEPVKQPRLGEPLKVKPPVPSAPPKSTYSRRNPDLDAALGFGPPPGQEPPPPDQSTQAPSTEQPKGEQPKPDLPPMDAVDIEREADVAQEVMQDPELGPLAQESNILTDPDSDPDVQAFVKAMQDAPKPTEGQDPEQHDKDLRAYLQDRKEHLATLSGRIARKMYAKDLKKAKQYIDGLDPKHPDYPKTPEERLAKIREKAKEFQEQRAENFKKMLAGTAWVAALAGGVAADALDQIVHASIQAYTEHPSEFSSMG
jgi:hypothetical protein